MKMSMYASLYIGYTVLLMATACSGNSGTASLPDTFFPQQRDTPNVYMEALLVGELTLVDGCLRLNDSDGNSFLLIWPPGFSLRNEKDIVQVVDDTGQFVAQVGDNLEVGGGEMPGGYISQYLTQPLPSGCSGPYWIVGIGINK